MNDRVFNGVHLPLEREADALIFGSLRGITSQRDKGDILTPWKEQDRRRREVYSATGTVDPQIRRGMYHRAANSTNSHLNSRDGVAPPVRETQGALHFLDPHTEQDRTEGTGG